MNIEEETYYEGIKRLNSEVGKNIAFIDENTGKNFSYSKIFELVDKCVSFLRHNGLKEGEAFQAVLPNSIEMIIFFLAAGRGGFKFAPCSEDATDKEIITYNKITNSKVVIFSSENNLNNIFSKKINKVEIELDCDFKWLLNITSHTFEIVRDGNLYIMTSGTTGTPKAIVLSFNKLWASTISFNKNYKDISI